MKKARHMPVELPTGMEPTSFENDSGELDSDTPVPLTVISNDNRVTDSSTPARPKSRPRTQKSGAQNKRPAKAKRGASEPVLTSLPVLETVTLEPEETPVQAATPAVKPRSVFYDVKFTLGLIGLVVGVNILLTMLIDHGTPTRQPAPPAIVTETPAPSSEGQAFKGEAAIPAIPAPTALPPTLETVTPPALNNMEPAAGPLIPVPLTPPAAAPATHPAQNLLSIIDRP